jgi:subtilisin family serine protease
MGYRYWALVGALALTVQVAEVQAQNPPANLGVPVDVREEVRNSFIFVLNDDVARADVRGWANMLANSHGGRVTRVYTTALRGFAAKMPGEAAARVAAQNPVVAYYEPDTIAFAFKKPPWAGGGDEETVVPSQETPWGVARVGGPIGGATGTAWVIDTGIDLDHADLNVDASRCFNAVFKGRNTCNDGNGHGTHVAGTIAAIDNEIDVVGVAAGATVVPVRVLDNSGSGSYSGVIAGIDHVAANASPGDAANPGDVANMSLGGPYSQALNDAVINAASSGIDFVLAAGNSDADANNYSPASADGPGIYTVSAIDDLDRFAWFSNYGNPPVDYAAPGVNVLSLRKGGGTTTYSGTSMAAPHVAGILLLGTVVSDKTASGDPDGTADPIAHR